MKAQDKTRFASALMTAAVVFDKTVTPQITEIYFRALDGFTLDEVERGIAQILRTLRFFPKPAELIDAITGGGVSLEDRAVVESSRVLAAIKSHGTWQTVIFDDPVTNAVIDQHFGGWDRFSELKAKDEKWFLKDFAAVYASFARAGVKRFEALPGQAARHNALTGYIRKERPVVIGNSGNRLSSGRDRDDPDDSDDSEEQ